jgi:hypothetical protein
MKRLGVEQLAHDRALFRSVWFGLGCSTFVGVAGATARFLSGGLTIRISPSELAVVSKPPFSFRTILKLSKLESIVETLRSGET